MDKIIPKEKLSKAKRREMNLKARAGWGEISPVTRIVPDKKKYDRRREKREMTGTDFGG